MKVPTNFGVLFQDVIFSPISATISRLKGESVRKTYLRLENCQTTSCFTPERPFRRADPF